jgi:DNA-binding MarR family transcriptional regulator
MPKKSTADSELSISTLRHFRVIFNSVKTHFQSIEKLAGIGGASIWALSIIQKSKVVTIKKLASEMDIHQSTASNLIKGLLALEYVTIEKDTVDRRISNLSITKAGEKLLKRAPGPLSGVLPNAISKLDDQTLIELNKNLSRLVKNISADKKSQSVPLANLFNKDAKSS